MAGQLFEDDGRKPVRDEGCCRPTGNRLREPDPGRHISGEELMATEKYRNDSRRLLDHARAELAQDDLRQASEKGWGAAALMLKAIAEDRDWDHERHRHIAIAAGRLRSEMGNRDVVRLFHVAEALHGNYYEDQMAAGDIAEGLDDVERLLDLIEPLAHP